MRFELTGLGLAVTESCPTAWVLAEWPADGAESRGGIAVDCLARFWGAPAGWGQLEFVIQGTVSEEAPQAWLELARSQHEGALTWSCSVLPSPPSAYRALRLMADLQGEAGTCVRFNVAVRGLGGSDGKAAAG